MRRVVLFDLDGTLTDPAVGIFNAIRTALTALGLPPVEEAQLRSFVGPPLHESFTRLGLSAATVEGAVSAYRSYFSEQGLYENTLYEGIQDVLQKLAADGHEIAVATSKPEVFAHRILRHFAIDRFFQAAVGSELDGSRSAKCDVIMEALRRVRAEPTEAVMVGDRSHDVLGASAVGLPCIGVTWGYAEPGELAAAGACCTVDKPEELHDAIALVWETGRAAAVTRFFGEA